MSDTKLPNIYCFRVGIAIALKKEVNGEFVNFKSAYEIADFWGDLNHRGKFSKALQEMVKNNSVVKKENGYELTDFFYEKSFPREFRDHFKAFFSLPFFRNYLNQYKNIILDMLLNKNKTIDPNALIPSSTFDKEELNKIIEAQNFPIINFLAYNSQVVEALTRYKFDKSKHIKVLPEKTETKKE